MAAILRLFLGGSSSELVCFGFGLSEEDNEGVGLGLELSEKNDTGGGVEKDMLICTASTYIAILVLGLKMVFEKER